MTGRFVLYMLTCGPLVLTLVAWLKLYWARRQHTPHALGLLALGIVMESGPSFGVRPR